MYYCATRVGFVSDHGQFNRDLSWATPFSTWEEADEAGKSTGFGYWCVLKA